MPKKKVVKKAKAKTKVSRKKSKPAPVELSVSNRLLILDKSVNDLRMKVKQAFTIIQQKFDAIALSLNICRRCDYCKEKIKDEERAHVFVSCPTCVDKANDNDEKTHAPEENICSECGEALTEDEIKINSGAVDGREEWLCTTCDAASE